MSALLLLASCQKEQEKSTLSAPVIHAEMFTHELAISWDPVKGADKYIYQFDGQTSALTTASFLLFTDLKAGTDYSFSVKAVASDGSSLNSEASIQVLSTVPEDLTFNATLLDASDFGISIQFEGTDDIAYVNWYLGSEFTYDEDYLAFVYGGKTATIESNSGSFTVTTKQGLQYGEPSVVFLQAISNEGAKSDIVEINATAAPISFTPSYLSAGSFVYTVNDFEDPDYIGLGLLPMEKEEAEEMAYYFDMSIEDLVQLYADYYYVNILAPGESEILQLNGKPETDHYIGVVYWGADYSAKRIEVLDYTSLSYNAGAQEATIDVSVEDITENSANLCFDPGKYTSGYVYRLFTNEDYEEYFAYGESYVYLNPLEYIREMVDAYGSRDYLTKIDGRTSLKAGTDYVLVAFPYNENGTQGWGESVVTRFSTLSSGQTGIAAESVSEPNAARISKISELLGKKVK